jgi:L,D-peptidoglycan transpeptidase YkuD (ErfK/YbiS/YcfS/YnhG family)
MPSTTPINVINVTSMGADRRKGQLTAGAHAIPCALGRSGTTSHKREGDGGTPLGTFRLLEVLYRPDTGPIPATSLPLRPIAPEDGWCDAPQDAKYNQAVRLPYPASHERLWRDDNLYNVVVVLDYNITPVVPGAGSAIFFHCAREDLSATEGCVAIDEANLRALLADCTPDTVMTIR